MQVIFVCSPRNQLKLKQVTNNVNTGFLGCFFLNFTTDKESGALYSAQIC